MKCACSTISERLSVTLKKKRSVDTVWLMVGTPTPLAAKIRHGEERAPGMDPTGRFPDKPRTSLGLVELDVSAEGVGLEDPGVVGQMRLRMLTTSIARVIEHRRGRI